MLEKIWKLQHDPQNHVTVYAGQWKHEGVIGIALRKRVGMDQEVFDYHAQPNEHGWLVIVKNSRGMTETLQGATFNLGLEVAAAVRRAI